MMHTFKLVVDKTYFEWFHSTGKPILIRYRTQTKYVQTIQHLKTIKLVQVNILMKFVLINTVGYPAHTLKLYTS